MTYEAAELSMDSARPVELFEFSRDYIRWRYTSADRDVTVDSINYTAKPLSRSAIEASAEKARSEITITGPRDLELADLYRISPPTDPITVAIRQYHYGDGEVATIWTGRVSGVEFEGLRAIIHCEPVSSALRRIGLRRIYQRQCPHVLYGAACGIAREAWMETGVVDFVAGFDVHVPQAALQLDGYYAGGYLAWEVGLGVFERRFILDHDGDKLTVSSSPHGLGGTMAVRLYPGCDHTLQTCKEKFNNVDNYGGFPYFPLKNPFGGDPIF